MVYAIHCQDCEAAYIGETGRTTSVRVAEHLAHARHGRVDLSAAADHAIVEGHRLDWMSAKVIDREKRCETLAQSKGEGGALDPEHGVHSEQRQGMGHRPVVV